VFAISIGLVVLGVALCGWNQSRAQMPRGASGSVLVFAFSDDRPMELVGPVGAPEGLHAGLSDGSPASTSELDTQDKPFSNQDEPLDIPYERYVTSLRQNLRSAAADLSENIIIMAVFLTEVLEDGLRSVQAERQ
jgi:hypothetical protein